MKREIWVKANGVDLKVIIEGQAPDGIARVMAREVQTVAMDFISDVTVSHVVYGETVEP